MHPQKPQIKRKPLDGTFGYIQGMGHTWTCPKCGVVKAHMSSPYKKQGINKLAASHRCGERTPYRRDLDG